MKIIEKQLEKIKQENRVGLMTHVVVGYPSIVATLQIIKTMADAGVDFIELQIPFSDPLADGPTIMKACEESLQQGTKVSDAFDIAKKASKQIFVPLLFMAYYNTVFCYGAEKFCRDAKKCGISGLIVPDMPIEEEAREHLFHFCKKHGLANIRVVSPVSTQKRLEKNALVATGFLYCTARQGITGVQGKINKNIETYLLRIKKTSSLPIAVGFGISKKEDVTAIGKHADIVVVGSALLDVINTSHPGQIHASIQSFIQSLR